MGTHTEIHRNFKLNGLCFSREDLREVAYSLVKEGEDFEITIGDFLLDWVSDEGNIVVKSSGSTGIPKDLVLEKVHMVNSALATGKYFSLKAGDTALHCLSTDFIAGKMMIVRAMVLGLELDYIAPSSNPLQETAKSYGFCAMVPLQVEQALPGIDRIHTLLVGGTPVPDLLKKELWYKNTLAFETYGMTETVTHVAVRALSKKALEFHDNNTEANLGSKIPFTALPGIKLSVDQRNCLIIDAPGLTRGPVVTNDLADLLSENQFHWLGRNDTIVNSGGVKIIPEQLEDKLRHHIASPFFAAGIPDSKVGERLVLVVEGNDQKETLQTTISSLSTLQKFERPRAIYFVESFLRTPSNKIRRKETLAMVMDQLL